MVVSRAAVAEVVALLTNLDAEATCDDAQIRSAIAETREALGRAPLARVSDQKRHLKNALIPGKNLLIDTLGGKALGLDFDEWSAALWDYYKSSTGGTASGQVCNAVNDDEDLWDEVVQSTLPETSGQVVMQTGVWWTSRRFVAMAWMTLGAVLLCFTGGHWSARTKVILGGSASICLVLADLWRRFGSEHAWVCSDVQLEVTSPEVPAAAHQSRRPDEDPVSEASASADLRLENERLRKMVEDMRAQGAESGIPPPPPPGAPPFPPTHGEAVSQNNPVMTAFQLTNFVPVPAAPKWTGHLINPRVKRRGNHMT